MSVPTSDRVCVLHSRRSLQYVQYLEKKFLWCGYWVGLGILSSVGLGTGLHTFLLYLVRYLSRCGNIECTSHFMTCVVSKTKLRSRCYLWDVFSIYVKERYHWVLRAMLVLCHFVSDTCPKPTES